MKRTTFFLALVMLASSLLSAGCAVAIIAGVTAGAGTFVWANGKLSFETDHTIHQCHSATTSALNELQIDIQQSMSDSLIAKVTGRTSVNEPVVVDIEPIGPHRTRVEIRVGTWGNKTQSKIIMDSIQRHLY
jgi:hypothetical protein